MASAVRLISRAVLGPANVYAVRAVAPAIISALRAIRPQPAIQLPTSERSSDISIEPPLGVSSYNFYTHRILKEHQEELGYKYETDSTDTWPGWLIYKGKKSPVIGFDIGLNSSSAKACCDDKAITSDMLRAQQIAHVEHCSFRKPLKEDAKNETWEKILRYAKQHNFDLVCKPKNGTGGAGVYRIKDEASLRARVEEMWYQTGDVCLSPYYEIKNEYRLIMLNFEAEIIFSKERPQVTGNGKDTVRELIQRYHHTLTTLHELNEAQLSEVLGDGFQRHVSWKHNLCFGAQANIIKSREDDKIKKLIALATKAAKAAGVCFASIDIIETQKREFKVLEINSGVMTEFLIKQDIANNYPLVKNLFKKALSLLLARMKATRFLDNPSEPFSIGNLFSSIFR